MRPTKEKLELVSKIHQSGDKDTLKMVGNLVTWMIEDIREQNDMCETEQWMKNKGAIGELKKLEKVLSGIDMPSILRG
jgi:hypothetical protein